METNHNQSIAAIILNWNNFEDTSDCIESLLTHYSNSVQIVVVDNNSTDNSLKLLREQYDRPIYLQSDSNLGFAGGMNMGIHWARAQGFDFVLLLNNDIIIHDDTNILNLEEKARESDIGLVTPKVYESTSGEPWFIKGMIDYRWLRFEHQTPENTNQRYIENEYVPLCCSLLPLDALEEVNDLSEEYFLYCEDVELGQRLREKGYRLLTDLDSVVDHKVGGSSESSFSLLPAYYRTRNRHLFLKRNEVGYSVLAYIVYSIWWTITRGIYAVHQNGIAAGIALVRGEIDGWLRRSGKGPY